MQNKFILTADASKHDHIKGAWTSGISIYVGDWYTSGNIVYECVLAHTSAGGNQPPNTTYWIPIIPVGTPLGSVSWKGAWSGATTYAAGDGCTYSSKAYVSIVGSNLNHVPPNVTYWVEVYYSYTGDVVGPGSAVSSNMAEFNGTTGKLLKDGALTHANVADSITKKHAADTDPSETSGWVPGPALTYSAADAPVYTVTCSGDYSAIIMAGMRIRLTHGGSTKYFIVVKSVYGAPNTSLTLYGGTDYTLAGTAITNPYYSMVKAPAGFPMSPAKWTVTATDSSDRSQASPTAGVWYNLGSMQISIPIGVWSIFCSVFETDSLSAVPVGYHYLDACLSTTNNGCTIPQFHWFNFNMFQSCNFKPMMSGIYEVTTKTTLYLNASFSSDKTCTSIDFHNDWEPMVIKAICEYL